MIIGTSTDGRALEYEELDFQFSLGGEPISLSEVRSLDSAGQLIWPIEEQRAWAWQLNEEAFNRAHEAAMAMRVPGQQPPAAQTPQAPQPIQPAAQQPVQPQEYQQPAQPQQPPVQQPAQEQTPVQPPAPRQMEQPADQAPESSSKQVSAFDQMFDTSGAKKFSEMKRNADDTPLTRQQKRRIALIASILIVMMVICVIILVKMFTGMSG